MLELAICDDDIILCNWLEQKLLHYGKANDCQISIEIYYSAEQLLNRLEEESYDMLFLMIKQEIWYLLPMKREEQILMLTTRQEI